METFNIYNDIAQRTDGSIYIGVIGPVRTGKSTFIKGFMEKLVLPNIENDHKRERARDELPQSANGKTIMTTEPKFVPNEAIELSFNDNAKFKVRLIDCVGYLVDGAIGHNEGDTPRLVNTPWFSEPIPFEEAAEIGTHKVINEHSTIGLVVTTDGSITDIPRSSYIEAEERVVAELKEIGKPFVILLNSINPETIETMNLKTDLEEKYETPVIAMDCINMELADINFILEKVLYEFPLREMNFFLPCWMDCLKTEHWLNASIIDGIVEKATDIGKLRDINASMSGFSDINYIKAVNIDELKLGEGVVNVRLETNEDLFYKIIGEVSGYEVEDDYRLINLMRELAIAKREYDKIKEALSDVKEYGYGMVAPSVEEIKLDEPEIVKQGNKFGVRLRASAPSLHIIRCDIETEIAPIVGSERQSQEFINYFMDEFENNPEKIWESNMFGKSLYDMVKEELQGKLYKMPDDIQNKLQLTLQKVVNDSKGGLICIII